MTTQAKPRLTRAEFDNILRHHFVRMCGVSPHVYPSEPRKNAEEHLAWILYAYHGDKANGVRGGFQIISFPELSIPSYQRNDLQRDGESINETNEAVEWLLGKLTDINALITFGLMLEINGALYNAQLVTHQGKILCAFIKDYLPDYAPHRESRQASSTRELPKHITHVTMFGQTFPVGDNIIVESAQNPNVRFTMFICEGQWVPMPHGMSNLANGALLFTNASASPFAMDKDLYRQVLMEHDTGTAIAAGVYVNAGPTEASNRLSFDGDIMVAELGTLKDRADFFQRYGALKGYDFNVGAIKAYRRRIGTFHQNARDMGSLYPPQVITFDGPICHPDDWHYQQFLPNVRFDPDPFVPSRDISYWHFYKERLEAAATRYFNLPPSQRRIVIGVSGGIDSTSIAFLAAQLVKTYGKELGMTLESSISLLTQPGFGTTSTTFNYAQALAEALGIPLKVIDIRAQAQLAYAITGHPNIDDLTPDDDAYQLLVSYAEILQRDENIALQAPRALANTLYVLTHRPTLVDEMMGNPQLMLLFENVQAWIRKFNELSEAAAKGGLVWTSSDLSEIIIGWGTLFADLMGHWGPNGNAPKPLLIAEMAWIGDLPNHFEPMTLMGDAPGYFAPMAVTPIDQRGIELRRFQSELQITPELGIILSAISRSLPSPELLPIDKDGKQSQLSDEINGPNDARSFFQLRLFNYNERPYTILRAAIHAFDGRYSPSDLYKWLKRFITRVIVQHYKPDMASMNGAVRVGSIAVGAHDDLIFPTDLVPTIWLQNLDQVPDEIRQDA